MKRRDFLNAAAITAGGAMFMAGSTEVVEAQNGALAGIQGETPSTPKRTFETRPAGKIEILFKAPGNSANGMQCSEEGIWTIDIAGSRYPARASLRPLYDPGRLRIKR